MAAAPPATLISNRATLGVSLGGTIATIIASRVRTSPDAPVSQGLIPWAEVRARAR